MYHLLTAYRIASSRTVRLLNLPYCIHHLQGGFGGQQGNWRDVSGRIPNDVGGSEVLHRASGSWVHRYTCSPANSSEKNTKKHGGGLFVLLSVRTSFPDASALDSLYHGSISTGPSDLLHKVSKIPPTITHHRREPQLTSTE